MWLLENSEIILGVFGFTIVAQFILHILLKNLVAWFRKAAEPDPVPDQEEDPWGDAKEPDEPSDDQDFPPLTEEDFPPDDVIALQDRPTTEEGPRFVQEGNSICDKEKNMYAVFPLSGHVGTICVKLNNGSMSPTILHLCTPEELKEQEDTPTTEESPRFVPVLNMVWDKQTNMYAGFPSDEYVKKACDALNQDRNYAEDFYWRPATDNYVVTQLKDQVRLEVTK
jgi:hypothetical protein